MLSRIVRSSATQLFSHPSAWQSSAIVTSRTAIVKVRHFSEKLSIPTDEQHQYGRRKEEIEAEDVGQVGFNREPIIPPDNAGTKENPILVPSGMDHRTVGYEDPNSHQLVWFNLYKGPLHYIPDLGLYFKLLSVK